MTKKNVSMELLAPAGTEDAFAAALHNGADAIYLGAGPHHARQFAGGFTEASFFALTEQAHIADVKVYLTLNTLLAENELKMAAEWAERAWAGGVDAVIVQDAGLASMLRHRFPDMVLHASTQMSLHNLEGVLAAKEAGMSRVVLARELSLEAIAAIRAGTDMELEVFGHGALCVCYSGQCLMSSLIGGRSGNRGMCAQPCRLPWKLSGNVSASGYLLSMKDLMSLSLIPKLQEAGVTSLKLEGRMKSPEYVAVVTGMYRKYLDLLVTDGPEKYRVDPADEKELRQIFNRGGFTRRYLTGLHTKDKNPADAGLILDPADAGLLVDPAHPKHLGIPVGTVLSWKIPYAEVQLTEDVSQGEGLEIHAGRHGGDRVVSTILTAILAKGKHEKQAFSGTAVLLGDIREPVSAGDTVYRTSRKAQLLAAAETVAHWRSKRVPLHMTFDIKVGEPAVLTVVDKAGHRISESAGATAEAAREKALTAERIREQLEKTGDAPWFLEAVNIRTDDHATMPVKDINSMRRLALEQLALCRAEASRNVRSMQKTASDGKTAEVRIPLPIGAESLMLSFATLPSTEWLQEAKLADLADDVRLALPMMTVEQLASIKAVFFGSIWVRIPTILPEDRTMLLLKLLDTIRDDVDGYVAGNPGIVRLLRHWVPDRPIMADTGMNLWNGESIRQAAEWGADLALLSPELTPEATHAIKNAALPLAGWTYGRVPVMTLEHCPGAVTGPCEGRCGICGRRTGTLTDRAGASFPYSRDLFTEKTVIHHYRPLRWQVKEQHPETVCRYVHVTDESPAAISSLLASLLSVRRTETEITPPVAPHRDLV